MSDVAPPLCSPSYWRTRTSGDELLAVLEERMATLIERHHDALKRIEELAAQLRERDDQLAVLGRRIEHRDRVHAEATVRLDAVLARIGACEGERVSGSATGEVERDATEASRASRRRNRDASA